MSTKKIFISIVIIFFIGVSLYIGVIYIVLFRPEMSNLPFNSAQWINAEMTNVDNKIRYEMHKDLIKNYELIGISKKQIITLLGNPSETDHFQDWDMVYWMGIEPGPFGIDSIWLLFKLDNEKIVDYVVMTD